MDYYRGNIHVVLVNGERFESSRVELEKCAKKCGFILWRGSSDCIRMKYWGEGRVTEVLGGHVRNYRVCLQIL